MMHATTPPPASMPCSSHGAAWSTGLTINVNVYYSRHTVIAGRGEFVGAYDPQREQYAPEGYVFINNYRFPKDPKAFLWLYNCINTTVPFHDTEYDIRKGETTMDNEKLLGGCWPWPLQWCTVAPPTS